MRSYLIDLLTWRRLAALRFELGRVTMERDVARVERDRAIDSAVLFLTADCRDGIDHGDAR